MSIQAILKLLWFKYFLDLNRAAALKELKKCDSMETMRAWTSRYIGPDSATTALLKYLRSEET